MPSPRKRGRPTKFSTAKGALIIKTIKAGHPYETACAHARIHYSTYRRWMIEGETSRQGSKLRDFYEGVLYADSQAEMRNSLRVQNAGETDWKAAAWWLKCRHPERWSTPEEMAKVPELLAVLVEAVKKRLEDSPMNIAIPAAVGEEVAKRGESEYSQEEVHDLADSIAFMVEQGLLTVEDDKPRNEQ